MNRILLILSCFTVFSAASQNGNVIWYFGDHAGLDFTDGVPVALTNSQMLTSEGCSTISDPYGNLLFYTNGVNVWNSNHALMQNGTGLMGNSSSTQSSVVVPNPANNGIFYIFTVASIETNLFNGFRYSVVDINQNGGLGAVTDKNILLFSPSCEKVAATSHENGSDYWVITHEWNSASFKAYLITATGISNPVISTIGIMHGGYIRNAIGYLRISPSGSRVAVGIEYNGDIELLNFNNQSGAISNPLTFTCPNNQRVYGVEFSPDETKLYVDSWDPSGEIFQFDITIGTASGIANSAIEIFSSAGTGIQRAAMQMGPDYKIYIARRYQNYVGVINNPNNTGLACNYIDEAVSLNGKNSRFGLPTFVQCNYNQQQNYSFENTCLGDTTYFYIYNTISLDSVLWNFDDPLSGNANYSNVFNPFHIFSSPGSFTVILISYFALNTDTTIQNVVINPAPGLFLGNDTSICSNNGISLSAGSGYISYLWQNGTTDSTFIVNTSGIYWVEVFNEFGCIARDSIFIDLLPVPDIDLGNDTVICPGDNLILHAGSGYTNYLWHNGSLDSILVVDTSGLYWVEVSNEFGCLARDSVLIDILPGPAVNLGNDTLICEGDSLELNIGLGFESCLWNTGSTDSSIVIDTAGIFWVMVTNDYGCSAIDSIFIDFYPFPFQVLELGNDTSFCFGEPFVLNAGSGYTYYEWQDGSHDSIHIADTTGVYWVYVSNPCGEAYDTISLSIFPVHQVELGNDTSVCHGEFVFLNPGSGFLSYIWQDGSVQPHFYANQTGNYWVLATDTNNCMVSDTINLTFVLPDPDIGSDTTICLGDSMVFSTLGNFVSYLWQNGSSNIFITADTAGIYWCEVTDSLGCTGSDTVRLDMLNPPSVDIGTDTSVCHGDSIVIAVSPGAGDFIYTWQDGSTDSLFNAFLAGSYWVEAVNLCGTDSDTVTLSVFPLPLIFLGEDTTLSLGDVIELDAGEGIESYAWQDHSTGQTLTVGDTGEYWVMVFDGLCYNSDTIIIERFPCDLFIPNVFTPNGDMWNKHFFAVASQEISDFHLTVFNRWGEKMFEATDIQSKWNGKRNGMDCAEGVYYWVAEYKCPGKTKTLSLKGSITLLR